MQSKTIIASKQVRYVSLSFAVPWCQNIAAPLRLHFRMPWAHLNPSCFTSELLCLSQNSWTLSILVVIEDGIINKLHTTLNSLYTRRIEFSYTMHIICHRKYKKKTEIFFAKENINQNPNTMKKKSSKSKYCRLQPKQRSDTRLAGK